jgi:regulatory protein
LDDIAYKKGLNLLSRRDHFRGELIQKLRDRGIDKEHAEQAAERLAEWGYLDDARLAYRLACDLRKYKLFSRSRVIQELCSRGVSRDTAQDAAAETDVQFDDVRQAFALLIKKRYTAGDGEQDRRRAEGLLRRYGYTGSEIRRAWAELQEQQEQEE